MVVNSKCGFGWSFKLFCLRFNWALGETQRTGQRFQKLTIVNTTRTHTAPSYAVSEELVFTTKQKDEKLLIKNTSVTDTQVLKMPLAMDVTANDGLEEQLASSVPRPRRRTAFSTSRSSASRRCSPTSASRSSSLSSDSTQSQRTSRRSSRASCTSSRRCLSSRWSPSPSLSRAASAPSRASSRSSLWTRRPRSTTRSRAL